MFLRGRGKGIAEYGGSCRFRGASAGAPGPEGGPQDLPPPPPPAPDAPPPSPLREAAQPAGEGRPPVPPPAGGAAKKPRFPWIIAAAAAAAAVVLILVCVVFIGDIKAPGGENSDEGLLDEQAIEKVVGVLLESLEKQDLESLLSVIEPDYLKKLEDGLGEDYESMIEDGWLAFFGEVEFGIEKLSIEIDGGQAKAKIVQGTVAYTDENGERATKEAGEYGLETIGLVKVDGKWYIAEACLKDMGLDPAILEEDAAEDGLALEVELPVDSEDEVLTLIMREPEIYAWVMASEYPDYRITDGGTTYGLYLFELDDNNNEVPFGWYAVDKATGKLSALAE